MTNITRLKTPTAPLPALGLDSMHIANQHTLEFIDEKGDHIPMFDPSDEDVLETQLDAYFAARDMVRQTIWR